ncbi:DUF5693 family protein [Chengkuizengella axinellae]|uniref:DUF5693 family protein n=1 Tax=Chengkuizengella axinellae TaxID=3064388 RepID=A0ABT9IZ35_9BACL|nr:DUF5693 family protein [Chengkuizengella sp. 2205SS18-9]MDP5274636.1 DUF5693 family protein [Chengkuizengella sp. 2205SS18-9]
MLKTLTNMNPIMNKALWILVVIGMIAAIPLGVVRYTAENTANQVEVVLDYNDVLKIAQYESNPQSFIEEQLTQIKDAGITSIAVFESSLGDLESIGRVELFSSYEASLVEGIQPDPNENFTYLLFPDRLTDIKIRPIIEQAFAQLEINVRDWELLDQKGLVIEYPKQKALIEPMDPDPMIIDQLISVGFQIVIRLSDNRPYDPEHMELLLKEFSEQGVTRIIFTGSAVTGYEEQENKASLTHMSELMNKYNIGFAINEFSAKEKGLNQLAYLTDYNVVRLHSLLDGESVFAPTKISDRLLLAVTDRNIRMLYLNVNIQKDVMKAEVVNSLGNIYESLSGDNGAIERIENEGFQIGISEPFEYENAGWQKFAKLIMWFGAVALIAITFSRFIPILLTPLFVFGMIGSAGLYVLNSSLLLQAAALGAAISAPTLAIITAFQKIRDESLQVVSPIKSTFLLFITATGISLIGAFYVVGMLNAATYMVVLEQFRGVSLLHLAPIGLAFVYYVFYGQEGGFRNVLKQVKKLFMMDLKVGYVIVAVLIAGTAFYYLTRTGNGGQVSQLELFFRYFLENVLGVRPRLKEFGLGHPMLLLGLFLALKYRKGLFLLIIGVIGQLSIIDTFAHLHTPMVISSIRVLYGLIFGIMIGLIMIAVWEMLVRSWKKWSPLLED